MKRRFDEIRLNEMRDHAAWTIHYYGYIADKRGCTEFMHKPDRLALLKLAEDVMVLENEVRYPLTLRNRLRRKLGLLP